MRTTGGVEDFDLCVGEVRIVHAAAELELDHTVVDPATHDERGVVHVRGHEYRRAGRLTASGDHEVARPVGTDHEVATLPDPVGHPCDHAVLADGGGRDTGQGLEPTPVLGAVFRSQHVH